LTESTQAFTTHNAVLFVYTFDGKFMRGKGSFIPAVIVSVAPTFFQSLRYLLSHNPGLTTTFFSKQDSMN
jgi:hypothetical protein